VTFAERLRELDAAATPGPWELFGWAIPERDADLIAFLRNHAADIADLVEAAERLIGGTSLRTQTGASGLSWSALRDALSRLNETTEGSE
jgi:hypothetical protein